MKLNTHKQHMAEEEEGEGRKGKSQPNARGERRFTRFAFRLCLAKDRKRNDKVNMGQFFLHNEENSSWCLSNERHHL